MTAVRSPFADALVRGLGGVALVPPDYEDVLLDADAARKLLRCEEADLAELLAAGLPTVDSGGEARFRRCDILNLGLYSGSKQTIPEVAEAHRVRFAAEGPERWCEQRRWSIALEARCPRGSECGEGSWHLRRPSPERFGGSLDAWPAGSVRVTSPLRFEAGATLRGVEGAVESDAARRLYSELVDEIVDERLRYQYLPAALRRDPEAAARLGAVDCMAAGLLLESRCRQRGVPARTRKGLLLGMVAVEHVWLEVGAREGAWQPLDPVLAALAVRSGHGGERFREFACGSVSNRLLAWDLDAHGEILHHDCGDGAASYAADELLITAGAHPH